MASDYLLEIDGFKGEAQDDLLKGSRHPRQPMSPSTRLRLQRLGMTRVGILQLAAGVPISNARDRRLVERLVADATRR